MAVTMVREKAAGKVDLPLVGYGGKKKRIENERVYENVMITG